MDLSRLSDEDLQALQSGDLSKVSDAGLQSLGNQQSSTSQYGSGLSYDAVQGQQSPTGSPLALAAQGPIDIPNRNSASPVTDEVTGFLKNAAGGAGKFLTDSWLGARQAVGLAGSQEAADKRALDAPLAATAGGQTGQIGMGALAALPLAGIPGVATYGGAAALGGIYGALTPVVDGESRAGNAGLGATLGAAGHGAGNMLGSWLTSRGSAPGLTQAQQSAVAGGAPLGMRITPGQQSASVPLQQFEAKLASHPWSSGPFNAIDATNREAINRAAATGIGEISPTIDSTVLAQANDRLGQTFDSVRDPSRIIQVQPAHISNALDNIDNDYLGLLPNNGSIRDNPLVQRFETLAQSGSLNGEQLGNLSSKLGKAAGNQMTSGNGDRQLGQALYEVKNHVDNLIQQTLSGPEATEYASARQQYRTLMQLTGRQGNINPATGNVSGPNLANYLQQTDRRGYLFNGNQSDLYNAARFSQAFKPVVGNSGTATRSSTTLADLAMGIPRYLLSNMYMTPMGSAIARGAVGASSALAPPVAMGRAVAPYLQGGLPGAGASLVPYLTE